MAIYNALLQYSYKWFARIRSLNKVQLLLDLLFITVVVHSSGGAVSWFWAMYMVLVLEAAMIMDRDSDTYAIALAGMIAPYLPVQPPIFLPPSELGDPAGEAVPAHPLLAH